MWAVPVALAVCLLAHSDAYFFESGFSHHYTYWADNSLFDQHNITTIIKFQISGVNETEEGHRLHSLTVDSLAQYVKGGILMNNPLNWDLTKSFLFTVDDKGGVRVVHCHPEDHEELLVIKKAMVSVFSVHVQIQEDEQEWKYTVQEHDHLGSLSHDYAAQREETGIKLHRKHFSSEHAFRTHEKTLHYDRHGTLHTAEARDHVLLKDRSPQDKPTLFPGEKPHKVDMSGDFPDIFAGATVKVTLDGKRPKLESSPEMFHNLTTQTLETKLKPKPKHNLEAVSENITEVFLCLRQFTSEDSENRSICVNELRDILTHLHEEDYKKFVDRVLGNRCQDNDTSCEDTRLVVIDVVARIGNVTSQDLLVKHVLSRVPAVDEELRRVFMHCVAMERPTEGLIEAVQRFCVGRSGEHLGSRAMTRTQSRACLAVGSLVRHCHSAGHSHTANRLLDRLESWLDEHGKGDSHVQKRDTWLEETEHEDHHISKAVLLHALGNAAMSRSRRHLMLHATPNRGHQMWRRAALDAMRKYNCTETARVMLECLMHDEKDTVRQMALSVYVNHPRRHEVAKDFEDKLLSKNYTYPAVARVKRDMFDDVLFKFKLMLPKLDWKKELGTSSVGASFGLYFDNGIDVLFRVLNGYVDVRIHDKVWAKIHLGIINKHWSILQVEACYKGRMSYNMNIVKDFTVGMMKDITSAFDNIAERIIEPLEKAASELSSRYQDTKTNTPKSGFQPLADAVRNLPNRVTKALQSSVNLTKVADKISGLPLVTHLQQLASRAQTLMEDVHTEATDLFTNTKDAAVVALPFAEKEIRETLNTVMGKLGDVSQHPRQVFSFIERSRMGMQLAMQRVLESNSIVKQSTSFLSGSRSSFMNSGHELTEIAQTARQLVGRLRADHARRKRQANPWEEDAESVGGSVNSFLDDIISKADAMVDDLTNTTGVAKDLQEGLDIQGLYTEILKNSYQVFKESIDVVKSRISALFGQKFHPKFPDQRRDCDDKCKCGYYPTDCTRYGHPGVDLKWDSDWLIPSPVAGLAKPAGQNSISIKPTTSGFTDYEIILSNIKPLINITDNGTFVDAGQNISTPVGENECEDSHFHLAMKRVSPDPSEGLCYYVDPSPFLDRLQPIPKWHQECKDFTFKHIFDTIDFSKLTEGFGPLLKALKRFALDIGKGLLTKLVDSLPDSAFLGPLKSFAKDIIRNVDLDPSNLKNLFKDAKNSMKGFFKNIGTSGFNVKSLMKMSGLSIGNIGIGPLGPLKLSFGKITGFLQQAKNMIKLPIPGSLKSLATGGIGRLLSARGIMSTIKTAVKGLLPSFGQGCSVLDAGANPLNSALKIGERKVNSLLKQATDKLELKLAQLGSYVGQLEEFIIGIGLQQVFTQLNSKVNVGVTELETLLDQGIDQLDFFAGQLRMQQVVEIIENTLNSAKNEMKSSLRNATEQLRTSVKQFSSVRVVAELDSVMKAGAGQMKNVLNNATGQLDSFIQHLDLPGMSEILDADQLKPVLYSTISKLNNSLELLGLKGVFEQFDNTWKTRLGQAKTQLHNATNQLESLLQPFDLKRMYQQLDSALKTGTSQVKTALSNVPSQLKSTLDSFGLEQACVQLGSAVNSSIHEVETLLDKATGKLDSSLQLVGLGQVSDALLSSLKTGVAKVKSEVRGLTNTLYLSLRKIALEQIPGQLDSVSTAIVDKTNSLLENATNQLQSSLEQLGLEALFEQWDSLTTAGVNQLKAVLYNATKHLESLEEIVFIAVYDQLDSMLQSRVNLLKSVVDKAIVQLDSRVDQLALKALATQVDSALKTGVDEMKSAIQNATFQIDTTLNHLALDQVSQSLDSALDEGISNMVTLINQVTGQLDASFQQLGLTRISEHMDTVIQTGVSQVKTAVHNVTEQLKASLAHLGLEQILKQMDSTLKLGVSQVMSLLNQVTDKLQASMQHLGQKASEYVSGLTSKVTTFVSGRLGMLSAVKSSACNVCPSFGNALSKATGSSCVPHKDCLGIDCDVTIQNLLVSGKIDFSLRVDPLKGKITITAGGEVKDLTADGSITLETQLKVLNVFSVRFKVETSRQQTELRFSLSVLACGFGRCLPQVPVIRSVKFDLGLARGKRSTEDNVDVSPFVDVLDSLPIEDVVKQFSDFNFPMEDITEQVTGIQDTIMDALQPNENQAEPSMKAEFISPKDYKDKGKFPVKGEKGELYFPFFYFVFVYPLGPVLFKMDFDAGGAMGLKFNMTVKAVDSLMQTEIKPWVSGKFRASVSIFIGIGSAGIDLVGWVLRTGFPLTLNTNYNKQPVVCTKALDVELIPIELKLKGWVKILFVINIKITIWHYRAPAIRGNIWKKVYRQDDKSAPRFLTCDDACKGRSKRQIGSSPTCSVHQIKGRHPKDAAFKLEFSVEDEDSDVSLSYAIGDYPGGINVQGWKTMRGNSLLSPAELPCGIPLHFLVKARNSQGLETTGRCSIPTFDCSFPDGRVDASHRCSSHPSKLQSQVILFEDSKLEPNKLYHGVGFSPSSFGHEVVDWQPLLVYNSLPQSGVSGDLRFFGNPRPGRLTSIPRQTLQAADAAICATNCMKLTTCVTFVYNTYLFECELHEVTEGSSAERRRDGHYQTYERLGKSYTATLRYENLPLRHGTKYYVNADIENVLGYRATLTSQGTMMDMTPPEPGPVGDVTSDNITADGCQASIIQRCEDHLTNSLNHRTIVDGAGSRTVFNGNRRGQNMAFTIENYHAAANWDGFKDEECGIYGYTWSVGSTLCGTDVASFVDPHSFIHNPDDWTHSGHSKDLHLPDGPYYVTVQAVSDIIHGGDLVTTVCHSTPFVVDTTPPSFHAVQEFLFDDSFRFLVVYYNVSDDISHVARIEFGLGKTKYDVMIRRYLPFEMRGVDGNTYIVNEEFETEDGSPAWIRLKVVNNVGLSATGAGETPILLDSTPPVPGFVLDGGQLGQDVCCQMSDTKICAQWVDFHDPDSNIDSYLWGVGQTPGKDDVVTFHVLTAYDKQSCVHVTLQHNVTYFSTVVANNKALNQKSSNASSDGLLIDVTPPVPGVVSDGSDVKHDINYTSETATVTASWADFFDPESGLADYTVTLVVNEDFEKTFRGISDSLDVFSDHSSSLRHGDSVTVELRANNRAGGTVSRKTDGVMVDHTPPTLIEIGTENKTQYQQRDDVLHFVWTFDDPESGVAEYRCVIFEERHGTKNKYLPTQSDFHSIPLNMTSPTTEELHLNDLDLVNGAAYSIKITAINKAKMATTEESLSVTVDTTPPDVLLLQLARKGEEEETNDEDVVEHVDKEPLWVTWSPHDTQSGIKTSHLCIGPEGTADCLSSSQVLTVDGSLPATLSFRDLNLQVSSEETQVLYRVYLVVINGAGLASSVVTSKPFLLLHANVAGVVSDGRVKDDVDFAHDTSSIAITFSGFSSPACGVLGYEWGVGTSPFATDVLPYTDYGLVVDEAGNGFAQVHVMQIEGQTYYSSVRASTGHNCHEQYIVASSDGFTVDTKPPTSSFRVGSRLVTSQDVVYQVTSDHLDVLWEVEDPSGLNETRMLLDVFDSNSHSVHVPADPQAHLALLGKLSSGDSLFPALYVADNAGNEAILHFPAVTFDSTPPTILDLSCTTVMSSLYSLLSCGWDTVNETHSALSEILIGLGSGPSQANLMNFTSVSRHRRRWSYDIYDVLQSHKIRQFYVIVRVINAAGLMTEVSEEVVNDVTPPLVADVIIVTTPKSGFHDVRQRCQTSQDFVEVLLTGMTDLESEIKSIELALGSSPGRSDVREFRECRHVDGMYVVEKLALPLSATVYVTARVTNAVGLYTIAASQSVVISPEPRLEVSDGPGETDRDGQSEVHVVEGRWRYSDPCPVLLAQWSVVELAGQSLTNFTDIPDNGTHFYNDVLRLENFRTYVNYVRTVDALNRTRTAYSDGVTVLITRPDTATVRDGMDDNDIDFQQPTDTLSANWDQFGDARSTLPSDHIFRYTVAVGTDRGLSTSRSDIHAFEDVGLNINVTFYGLNLTAKTQNYYVTVRAYSAAGSYVESSTDGIRVGFSGDIKTGLVEASEYQSSTDSLRFWWVGFDSDMVITHYYAGISSQPPAWDNETQDCTVFLHNHTSLFDVRPLEVLEEESLAVLEHLNLEHGKSYYVSVIAADRMGHCSAAASGPVLVDTTPPVKGKVSAEGFNADTVIFVHSPQTLAVSLDDFPDPESGVHTVTVDLVSSTTCSPDTAPDSVELVRSVQAENQSVVFIRNLQLEEKTLYFVRVTVRNGAGLDTRATSRPVLLDTTPPRPGLVKLGRDWTGTDQTFQPYTDTVSAVMAVQSLFESRKDCVTQVDLLSMEVRQNWTSKRGNFSANCVGFDDGGLHVMVQHNSHLTGVDRGAAQFGPMALQEGNYQFRLTPAVGDDIITGVSLTSPTVQPPFFMQNGLLPNNRSSLPCDTSDAECHEDRNETVTGSLGGETDYGMGLTFLTREGKVRLLLWAQDAMQLKQTWVPVDFDLAASTADYTLTLSRGQGEVWEVSVAVNDQSKASVSGLLLPGPCVLTVYGWNVNDSFPPVLDPFHPFRAVTLLRSLSVPLHPPPPCSHGNPFTDLTSDLAQVWVGISNSYNTTSGVANDTLVKSFCLPCLQQCAEICSSCQGEYLSDDFTLLPLILHGLRLQAGDRVFANTSLLSNGSASSDNSNDTAWDDPTALNASKKEMSEFQLPTYYLHVRVVDHSGLETVVRSAGLVIDTSPPVVRSLYCFNPQFSKDVEIAFLGNNHTVGVTWEVFEDISDVSEVKISLGSRPGQDDIVHAVTLGKKQDHHIFTNMDPPLEEDTMYYVTLQVENEAGLISEACSNFTVHSSPPDMSEFKLHVPNVTTLDIENVTFGVMENSDRFELALDVDPAVVEDMDIEYYELAIGTREGKDDVFPKTIIGAKGAKKISIVHGFVQRDETPAEISVGDYTKKNYSTDDLPDPSANLFNLEPGRCLKEKLFGVSKAHIAASFDVIPLCIKRADDVLLKADSKTHLLQLNSSGLTLDAPTNDTDALNISVTLKKGAILAGALMTSDLAQEYGTSASAEFSPFIVWPDAVTDPASRLLRKRLVDMPGPKVFVSPLAEVVFADDLTVSYFVPHTVLVPDDSIVSLIFWNAEVKEWETPDEVCSSSTQTYDNVTRHVTLKLCPEIFSQTESIDTASPGVQRKRRSTVQLHSTSAPQLGPRMLTLAVIKSLVPNLPPVVHNTTFTLLEDDGMYNFTLTFTDPEGDDMTFWLSQQSVHGTAVVTPEGMVSYKPKPNYNGMDTINVKGKELLEPSVLANGVVPNEVSFTIVVHITGANDPPDIFYLPGQSDSEVRHEIAVGPTAGNGLNMTVYLEANTTTHAILGLVVFSDVDHNDVIHYTSASRVIEGVSFEESNVSSDDERLSDINLTSSTGISGKEISLTVPEGYAGHVTYDSRVKDGAGTFSMQLTLNVFVLNNPCIDGDCKSRDPHGTCLEQQRSVTFDPYFCHCDFGYEGEWCQTETDECRTATCSPITDCVDLVGGYRCDANPTKMAAIIVCSLLAAILIVLAIIKLKKRSNKVDSWSPLKSTDDLKKEIALSYRSSAQEALRPVSRAESVPETSQPNGISGTSQQTDVKSIKLQDFEFFRNDFFSYQSAQNPTAGHAKGFVTNTGKQSPKTNFAETKGSQKMTAASCKTEIRKHEQKDQKPDMVVLEALPDRTSAKESSHVGVNTSRPSSTSSDRHFVSTGPVRDKEMPKVDT